MLKCQLCEFPIYDREVCKIDNEFWHSNCLKCSVCYVSIEEVCHYRNGRLFCKQDYHKLHGNTCATCNQKIDPNEKVFKSGGPNQTCPIHFTNELMRGILSTDTKRVERVSTCLCQPASLYHLKCFICCVCERQLNPGETYISRGTALFCSKEFQVRDEESSEGFTDCNSKKMATPQNTNARFLGQITTTNTEDEDVINDDFDVSFEDEEDGDSSTFHDEDVASTNEVDSDNDSFRNSKRPRTILTAIQRRRFKHAFEMNPKPTRKIRENLANETGLNVRVVQVWFQNQRAKVKKIARRQNQENNQLKRSIYHLNNSEQLQHLFPFQPFSMKSQPTIHQIPTSPSSDLTIDPNSQRNNNVDYSLYDLKSDLSSPKGKSTEAILNPYSQTIADQQKSSSTQQNTKQNCIHDEEIGNTNEVNLLLMGEYKKTTQNPINRLFSMQESYFTAI